MALYEVTLSTQGTEVWEVEATSAEDALDRVYDGVFVFAETVDSEFKSAYVIDGDDDE